MFKNPFRFAPKRILPIRQRRGLSAEEHAAKYLRSLGYRILGRRIRTSSGSDIDILAVDGKHLVFVEVRAKQSHAPVSALQSIRDKKRKALLHNVRYLTRRRTLHTLQPRIDILAIDLENDHITNLTHYPNALPCNPQHPD